MATNATRMLVRFILCSPEKIDPAHWDGLAFARHNGNSSDPFQRPLGIIIAPAWLPFATRVRSGAGFSDAAGSA